MLLIPYRFDITFTRAPFANAILIGFTILVSTLLSEGFLPVDVIGAMILKDWSLTGIFGCLFLHGGFLHLLGNMIFLWVFGNAVCSTVGNGWYIPLYLFLGAIASVVFLLLGHGAGIGASGAINGIVGMSFILFPVSLLNVTYSVFFVIWGRFQVKGFWMILLWFAFDIIGIILGGGHTAYWAHIGGFVGGMVVGTVLVMTNAVESFDTTLIDILQGNGEEERRAVSRRNQKDAATRTFEIQQALALDPDFSTFVIDGRRGIDPQAERIHRMMTGEVQETDSVEPPPAPPVTPGGPPLNLRVLRVSAEFDQTTCYFVNDGEEMRDLVVSTVDYSVVTVHPSKLMRRGEPGWFKFHSENGRINSNPGFLLEYTTASGERHKRTMTFSIDAKKIRSGVEA